MLQCGIYEHDITPPLGAQMPGYFNVRLATGIKEPLKTSAVVFAEDGKVTAVIVSADAIQVPKQICLDARRVIAEKLGCDEAAVTIHATHVHTGGPVLNFVCTEDEVYCTFLGQRIVDCAVLASQQLRDVKIGFARGWDNTIAHYRDRVLPDGRLQTNAGGDSKPFGDIDPEIGVLVIDNADGTRYGCIVNYACHTDCVSGTEFSSDFPGAMRDTLRATYGQRYMPVFLNGFFGNLNHIDFEHGTHRRPYYYRSMGRKLAGKVMAAMEDATWFESPAIRAAQKTIVVKSRMPDEALLEWARGVLANPDGVAASDLHFAHGAIEVAEEGQYDFDLCLQVMKIGPVNLFACPREMFVEFETMLKENSDSQMNLCACNANGGCGYVPIRELIQPGIYEARVGKGKLEPDTGYYMVGGMLELMKSLS